MPAPEYLSATWFLDHDHPNISAFVSQHVAEGMDSREKMSALYLAVRDGFRYDAYRLDFKKEALKASVFVQREYGYCTEKACLYAACLRAVGIPARLFFGDVRNHLAVKRLTQLLGTDRLVFHGCTEVWNGEQWLKATPAFNKELCEILGVDPLEFNGTEDSIFQRYNKDGEHYMEYLKEYGSFADMPYDFFMDALEAEYGLKDLRGKTIDLRQFREPNSEG